jgi:hypothetical protein
MKLLKNFLFVFILIPVCCFAQDKAVSDIDSVAGQLIKNMRSNVKEKILLQTNKQVYGIGERIWFKAYVIDSLHNRLTNKSKILFVDLVDEKDSIVSQLFLHADKLKTNGAIVLNDSSLHGYYWLRAYTKKMIDENTNNIAMRPLYVINNKMKNDLQDSFGNDGASGVTDTKPLLDIYPEGGWLISGANSVVAVKAHEKNGNPLAVSGIVKDSRDTVVARFSTNNKGLGKFSFSPAWFGKYKVYIQNKERYDSVTVLPRVNPYAAQLSVIEQNDQFVKVRVMLEDSIYTNDYTTYIIGISKDSLCFAGVGRGMYELNIPVLNFPGGVASLLLYNTKKQLVSERNIYINKKDFSINVSTDKQNYAARENVKMNIDVTDAAGKPMVAALSIAVADSRIADTINNFLNDSLSNYSFSEADLFMCTQKAMAKDWMNINGEPNISLSPNLYDTLTLKGTVVTKKKEPVPGQEVMLMSNKNNIFILQDTTDVKGRFSFWLPDYDDGTEFNLQVSDLKGVKQDYDIVLDPPDLFQLTTPYAVKKRYYEDKMQLVKRIETYHMDSIIFGTGKEWLMPVKVKATIDKKIPASANIITREMLQKGGFNSVGDAMLGVPGVHLQQGLLVIGGVTAFSASATDEPIVVQNGVQIPLSGTEGVESSPVLSFLKSLSSADIDYIKILTGPEGAIYGLRGGHGVIEVHSSGRLTNYASSNGLKTLYPKGFHVAPAFAMPDYKNNEIKYSKFPDLRTTIYWNGDIITDKDGKAAINFFTADTPATYVVTVTGVTANGDKIYKNIIISRK